MGNIVARQERILDGLSTAPKTSNADAGLRRLCAEGEKLVHDLEYEHVVIDFSAFGTGLHGCVRIG